MPPSQETEVGKTPAKNTHKESYPAPTLNLENTFVYIDGKRHDVIDLLELVVDKLKS